MTMKTRTRHLEPGNKMLKLTPYGAMGKLKRRRVRAMRTMLKAQEARNEILDEVAP